MAQDGKPRETVVIAEINGVVKYGEVSKGMRKIYITGDDGEQKEYALPRGVHINVQEGERVKSGDPLMDGPPNPHDILHVLGEQELQKYLVNEIQEEGRQPARPEGIRDHGTLDSCRNGHGIRSSREHRRRRRRGRGSGWTRQIP